MAFLVGRISDFKRSLPTERTSILLTVLATALGLFSIYRAKLVFRPFGLINGLPFSFLISLFSLFAASAVLWYSPRRHSRLLGLQACILVFFLYATPLLVAGCSVNTDHALVYLGFSDYINRSGHIDAQAIYYHNWPISWIMYSELTQILSVNVEIFVTVAPFAWNFFLLPCLYLFFKYVLGKDYSNIGPWVGVWFFYLGQWSGRNYLGAQSYGFALYLIAILLVLKRYLAPTRQRVFTLFTIIVGALAATHVMSALWIMFITLAFSRFKRLPPTFAIIAIILVGGWSIYGATAWQQSQLDNYVAQMLDFSYYWRRGVVERLAGNEAHQVIARVRLFDTVMLYALGFSGFILARLNREKNPADSILLRISFGLMLFSMLFATTFGIETPNRFLFAVLPILGYFSLKLLKFKRTRFILFAFLLASHPLFFVTYYGNFSSDYFPPAHLGGVHFFHEHTTMGTVSGGRPIALMRNMENYLNLVVDDENEQHWVEAIMINHSRVSDRGRGVYYPEVNILDTTGNNSGTNHGASRVTGKVGYGLSFDGSENYVDCGNGTSLDIIDAITLEAWVILTSGGADSSYDIIRKDGGYELYTGNGKKSTIGVYLYDGSWHRYTSESSISLDGSTWYHLVVTWDKTSGDVKFYINGTFDVTRSGRTDPLQSSGICYLGGSAVENSFYGIIDEARIYNRALSASEIESLYNGQRITNELVSEWKFEYPLAYIIPSIIKPYYLAVCSRERAQFDLQFNRLAYYDWLWMKANEATNFNLFYSNPDISLYIYNLPD